LEPLIKETIRRLTGGEEEIERQIDMLIQKHLGKVHFIPLKYRVLGGLIQSLNIKFGEFVEMLLDEIIASEPNFTVVKGMSRVTLTLELEENCERFIDEYINNPPRGRDEILSKIEARINDLYSKIFLLQNSATGKFHKKQLDINVLFKFNGTYYYVETKYNDDHDTGKFQDINRKFLKTYAGLVKHFKCTSPEQFKPILYYFNQSIRYDPNPYLRENIEIMRGPVFFTNFKTETKYEEIERILNMLGDSLEEEFDGYASLVTKKVRQLRSQKTL